MKISLIKTEYYKLDNRNFKTFFLGGEAASTILYNSTFTLKSFANPTDAISFMVKVSIYRLILKSV
jgi:hypothetical protein